jgi:hypothetical protein
VLPHSLISTRYNKKGLVAASPYDTATVCSE